MIWDEVEQLFGKAWQSEKANDYVSAAQYNKKAAEYGNSDSMFALGEYYGKKGENQDFTFMYYQKAEDQVYEANVENEMPAKIADPYSHGKEYYRSCIDRNIAEYNGLFYFIRGLCLCTSDEQGNNIKTVSVLPGKYYNASIHVNCTGIYLYCTPNHGVENQQLFHTK